MEIREIGKQRGKLTHLSLNVLFYGIYKPFKHHITSHLLLNKHIKLFQFHVRPIPIPAHIMAHHNDI